MSETVLRVFEIIGTVAFALSGAMTGLQKRMDIFGVAILGLTTAVGGGVIRDIVLGQTPPAMFSDPLYALVAIGVAIVAFFPSVRRLFDKGHTAYEVVMLLMDSVGLGVFTVVGIRVAHEVTVADNPFLMLFVGVVTGIGGGVLRDIMAGNTPYIFIKHFYASASLIGALVCIGLWHWLGETVAMIAGAAVVIVLRLLAARFHWSLPRPKE